MRDIRGLLCRTSTARIDEAFDTGKGANAVISMLHYYLENHGLNATVLHFNADNCTGQNKNNAVIQVNLVKIVYTFFILHSIIVSCVESFDRAKLYHSNIFLASRTH